MLIFSKIVHRFCQMNNWWTTPMYLPTTALYSSASQTFHILIPDIVHLELSSHLASNSLFVNHLQSSVWPLHSIKTVLIKVTKDLLAAKATPYYFILLLVNLSFTFDTVNIPITNIFVYRDHRFHLDIRIPHQPNRDPEFISVFSYLLSPHFLPLIMETKLSSLPCPIHQPTKTINYS